MFKIIPIGLLIVLFVGFLGLYKVYDIYRDRQHERLVKLQQQAEEVKVTIIEGLTIEETAQKFETAGLFSKQDFLTAANKFNASSYPFVSDKPNNTSLEGYLFPDTYRFPKRTTPDEVIAKMLDNFSSRLKSIGLSSQTDSFKIPGYGNLNLAGQEQSFLSLYQIITLASIVEKESGSSSNYSLEDERKLIAGVFYNRLSIGQALESDTTVNFITKKNDPSATIADTKINSPYNTYRYAGLPPGPIANPSLGSIEAVLNPTKSDYYYFLHKQPSGEVVFSRTFSEHIKNKQP